MYKSSFLLAFFLLLLSIPLLQAQKLPLWFDDALKDNVNRWDLLREGADMLKVNTLGFAPERPYRILARVNYRQIEANGYAALVFGRLDGRNAYLFEVNKEGEYRISQRIEGQSSTIRTWKKAKGISKSGNTLELQHTSEKEWVFRINGDELYRMPARPFFGSEFGFLGSMGMQPERFTVYYDSPERNIAPGLENYKAEKENLGSKINSEATEKFPVISPDGKYLYVLYEEERGEAGAVNQQIWYSQRQADSSWSQLKTMGEPINNRRNNFLVAALPDNNTLALINSYENLQDPNALIALTTRTKEGWAEPKSVVINGLQKQGRWVALNLAADGKTLVYAMQRADSYGGRDIYVSFLEEDGSFSPPKNLGPTINTRGNEHCPFLAADGKTLYFDTDGHPGFGGRDIFVSRRLDETWTKWSEPQNLGPAFNGIGSDEGLMIPASGEYAYLASSENSLGGLDIFRIKMPPALRPEPTALITGVLLDAEGQPLETSIRILDEGGKEIALARSDPSTGGFTLALPGGSRYQLKIEHSGEDKLPPVEAIDLRKLKEYEERDLGTLQLIKPEPPVALQPTPPPVVKPAPEKTIEEEDLDVGKSIRLDKIYFKTASHELLDSSYTQLEELVGLLKKYPRMRIAIQGHTDSRGARSYNYQLSDKRSKAVRQYLETKGIEPERLQSKGFGSEKPVASNASEAGRQANRRVEFLILEKGAARKSD